MSSDDDKPEIDDIGCLAALEVFYAYLDNELDDPGALTRLEHHMGHCRNCYTRAELERSLTTHIRKSAKSRAPEVLRTRLRNLLDKF